MTEREQLLINLRWQAEQAEGMIDDLVDAERAVLVFNPFRPVPPALIDTELMVAELTAAVVNPIPMWFGPGQADGAGGGFPNGRGQTQDLTAPGAGFSGVDSQKRFATQS